MEHEFYLLLMLECFIIVKEIFCDSIKLSEVYLEFHEIAD